MGGAFLGAILAIIVRFPNAVDIEDMMMLVPMTSLSAFTFWFVWRLGENVEKS